MLVEVGRPQLSELGFLLAESRVQQPEHKLYKLLEKKYGNSAYSQYNAFIRRLVSFERAAACAN